MIHIAPDPLTLFLPDEAATQALGRALADLLLPGDAVLLSGDVGAGKSCLARAIIHRRLGSATEVPSPTFTLVQTYDAEAVQIWHADLYRLSHPDEVAELGLLDAAETAICLVEWPERAALTWPGSPLQVVLTPTGEGRMAQMRGNPRLLAGLRADV